MTPKLAVDRLVEHDIIIGVRKAERGDGARELTAVQTQTLEWIRAYVAERGYSPTLREIADGVGVVLSDAAYRIKVLVAHGYLRRQPGSPRTLVLVDRRPAPVAEPCSVCGRS